MRLGLRTVAWGCFGHVIFFRKRLAGFLYLKEYVFLWSHCFIGVFDRRTLLFLSYNKNNGMFVILFMKDSQLSEYLNFIAVTRAAPELQQVEVEVEATH